MREPSRLAIAKENAKARRGVAHEQAREIQQLKQIIQELGGRVCDECGKPMKQGYCTGGGLEHYCSSKCLHVHYTPEERRKMYNDKDEESFRTEREDRG